MRRVFFFAPISTDGLNRKYKQNLHVGAATNKVLGVCSALRSAGFHPVIVSGLIPSRITDCRGFASHTRSHGICFAKLFSTGHGIVKRVVASFSFLLYAMRYVRAQDRVILYNFFPEYIFAALYLRVVSRSAVIDIEDAPRSDQSGLRGVGNGISFIALKLICEKKYLTVSHQVGYLLKLPRFLPVYGVASFFEGAISTTKFGGDVIKVLFGGAIILETGLGLFAAAVRLLASGQPDIPINFFITGVFPQNELRKFAEEIEASSKIRVTVLSDLSAADYRKLAKDMDVGLCLKLPSHSIGQTTFPSKVIEYAALGMLVCSTAVSDVPSIFHDGQGIILETEDPEDLAAALIYMVKDRKRSASMARAGQQNVVERFSKENVGRELVEFLDD